MPALARWVPVVAACLVVLLVSAAVLAIVTLVRRWRASRGAQRLALAAAGAPLAVAISLQLIAVGVRSDAIAVAAILVAAIGLPAGIWVAVARYRLYDLDLAIARSLAYGIVAVGLAGVFAVTAALAGLVAGGQSRVAVAVAAAAAATAFASARVRVIGLVERSVLGPAGDPQRAAALVGRRLARPRTRMCCPSWPPRRWRMCCGCGASGSCRAARSSRDGPGRMPAVLSRGGAGDPGHLGPGDGCGAARADRGGRTCRCRVARRGAHRRGRRSRAELVAAVEDERRRLRRDLHDGLGPRLATLAMGLDAAHNRVAGTTADPGVAVVLTRLRAQADEMLASVRYIVSGLRPPVLDQYGLAEALRLHAAELAEPGGLAVEVLSGDLGPLTAAMEVAAYRIATEAMLNAARHSGGRRCQLTLARDNGLRLTVTDDGHGIPDRCPAGVGTHSMRERAAALGGWVAIGPAASGGTEVRAWLPAAPS